MIKEAYDSILESMQTLGNSLRQNDEVSARIQWIRPPAVNPNDKLSVPQRSEIQVDSLDTQDGLGLATALTHVTLVPDQHPKFVTRYPGIARVPDDIIPLIQQVNAAKKAFVATIEQAFPTADVYENGKLIVSQPKSARMRRQRAVAKILNQGETSMVNRRMLERRIFVVDQELSRLSFTWERNPASRTPMTLEKIQQWLDERGVPKGWTPEQLATDNAEFYMKCVNEVNAGHRLVRYMVSQSPEVKTNIEFIDGAITSRSAGLPIIIPASLISPQDFETLKKVSWLKSTALKEVHEFKAKGPGAVTRKPMGLFHIYSDAKKVKP